MRYSEESAKKAAKAELKREKKEAKRRSNRLAGEALQTQPSAGPTPAERAAAAAERQVQLHRYRLWLSVIAILVAIASFVWSAKPWRWLASDVRPVVTGQDQPAS